MQAVCGVTPKIRSKIGVISALPSTPVKPTTNPVHHAPASASRPIRTGLYFQRAAKSIPAKDTFAPRIDICDHTCADEECNPREEEKCFGTARLQLSE